MPEAETLERRMLLSFSFSEPLEIVVGEQPGTVVAVDLNGDGAPDIAVGLRTGLAILMNDGTGSFSDPVVFPTDSPIQSLAFADMNGNGLLDAVGGGSGAGALGQTLYVFMGNGDGTFEDAVDYDAGFVLSSLALGDLTGDGRPDVVLTNPGANTLSIMLNQGDGTLADRVTTPTGENPHSVRLADVNGNGRLDAVLASITSSEIWIHNGNGDGTFDETPTTLATSQSPRAVVVADFNGDGIPDIVASQSETFASNGRLAFFPGLPAGGFGDVVLTDLGVAPRTNGLAIGDLNLNGRLDVVIANTAGNAGEARINNGIGHFSTFLPFVSDNPDNSSVALADIDGDGDLDLLVAHTASGKLSIFSMFRAPVVGSLVVSASVLPHGTSFTLEAKDVSDPDGTVERVRFYIDLNGNGVGDEGELLFVDANPADGFIFSGTVTADYPLGEVSFLAVAIDNDGVESAPASLPVNIVYSTHAGSGARVGGTSGSGNLHTVSSLNLTGLPIVFEQVTAEGWTVRDLAAATGSPIPTGDPVAWADSTDGRLFVFAPSAEGLIAYRRNGDGSWTFQNVTELAPDARAIVSAVTVFADVSGRVHVAGLDGDGDLVLYARVANAEDGSPGWAFENLSETHLRAGGQDTPAWVGPIISYVTRWDGLNIAALDGDGRVQVVWTSPELGHWRVDDLSAITGAPALSGGLTAYLTEWDGINLAGLNASGQVTVTWWVPAFDGNWETSNLTTLFGGPTLPGGGLTSYVTPWGGLNVAGLSAAGDLIVYWWVPQFADDPETDVWVVSNLSEGFEEGTPAPVGQITSHASDAGTLNLFGAALDGRVLRYFWNPGDGGDWSVRDLSTLAGRL